MRIVLFCHSLVSDWNHGNAHFLRGITTELIERGHDVQVLEPVDAWSRRNLLTDHGPAPIREFHAAYPRLSSRQYRLDSLDLDRELDGVDLVLVHEWNDHELVARVGRYRASRPGFLLLFHDTHHRSITDPESMGRYDLEHYDGVLAFGESIREVYERRGWGRRVWTWHEAADTRIFRPLSTDGPKDDLAWIGNWGDEERTGELSEFLLNPARELGLRTHIHGVRYPEPALAALQQAGIRYRGWLPNYRVPETFARHRVTIHVPRRPYVRALPGIPTIRPFEAMACGIPLISAPWNDTEGLFRAGQDYLVAHDGAHMCRSLRALLADEAMAAEIASNGLQRVLARHTCSHRVDELLTKYHLLSNGMN